MMIQTTTALVLDRIRMAPIQILKGGAHHLVHKPGRAEVER